MTELTFAPTIQAMLDGVKKRFGYRCVISGIHKEDLPPTLAGLLDTAHIFPRSVYPELRTCIENGLSICRYRHNWPFEQHPKGCLDKDFTNNKLGRDRTPVERIEWIVENVHEDFRDVVMGQMVRLIGYGSKISPKIQSRHDELLEILGGK